MVRAGEISYVSSTNGEGPMTVTQDYHAQIQSDRNKSNHRSLSAASEPAFLGAKTKKSAGDFDLYTSKCDLKLNGWKLLRPELYEIKLMYQNNRGESSEVKENDTEWNDCPDPEGEDDDNNQQQGQS